MAWWPIFKQATDYWMPEYLNQALETSSMKMLQDFVAGKAAIAAAERSLANAKARLDLAELRYRTGVGNGIELSDAQLAATNAGFQLLQATLKLDTARAQLLKALGRS